MLKPTRFAAAEYRYGFGGMEQDGELKGIGNSYTTLFRQYDPRTGRWWSNDPVYKPWESSYVGYGNNPILFIDPHGDDIFEDISEFFIGSDASPISPGSSGIVGSVGNFFGGLFSGREKTPEVIVEPLLDYLVVPNNYDPDKFLFEVKRKRDEDNRKFTFNNAFNGTIAGVANSQLFFGLADNSELVGAYEEEFADAGQDIADNVELAALPFSIVKGGVKQGAKVSKTGFKLLNAAPARLTQEGLDHIIARHWFSCGAKGAGKFTQDMTGKKLKSMIQTATSKGVIRQNTMGRAGTIAEYNFGSVIGTNIKGGAATNLRVIISPNGNVITAFPF